MRTPGHRLAFGLFVSVLVLWMAALAALMRAGALPPEASGSMLAIFPPGTAETDVFASLTKADARIVRPSAFGFIWVVSGDTPGLAGRLKANGALGAYRDLPISPTIAGCFALADAKAAEAFGP
jgi:hypothetical protein